MIQNIDYAPTFLDAAGIPIPSDIQGESLLPLMEGRSPGEWRESIYYHYYEFPAVHMVAKHYGVRTDRLQAHPLLRDGRVGVLRPGTGSAGAEKRLPRSRVPGHRGGAQSRVGTAPGSTTR